MVHYFPAILPAPEEQQQKQKLQSPLSRDDPLAKERSAHSTARPAGESTWWQVLLGSPAAMLDWLSAPALMLDRPLAPAAPHNSKDVVAMMELLFHDLGQVLAVGGIDDWRICTSCVSCVLPIFVVYFLQVLCTPSPCMWSAAQGQLSEPDMLRLQQHN